MLINWGGGLQPPYFDWRHMWKAPNRKLNMYLVNVCLPSASQTGQRFVWLSCWLPANCDGFLSSNYTSKTYNVFFKQTCLNVFCQQSQTGGSLQLNITRLIKICKKKFKTCLIIQQQSWIWLLFNIWWTIDTFEFILLF